MNNKTIIIKKKPQDEHLAGLVLGVASNPHALSMPEALSGTGGGRTLARTAAAII
jgi:hypothetical protein